MRSQIMHHNWIMLNPFVAIGGFKPSLQVGVDQDQMPENARSDLRSTLPESDEHLRPM